MTTHANISALPFELGEAQSFGGLTVVPLFPAAQPQVEYVGLDEAVAGGLTVTEVHEAGAVESLLVQRKKQAMDPSVDACFKRFCSLLRRTSTL
jgi:hypothetical protein